MKKYIRNALFILLTFTLIFSLSACSEVKEANVWDNATYSEDTVLGSGAKTFTLVVKAEEKSVAFTIKTDKNTVGEALIENKLISGEQGAYGIYVKFVNGIEADYNKNQSYWAFFKHAEGLMTGVDGEQITEGARYELVYTKQ